MASLVGFGKRLWTSFHPPEPVKAPDAIRIGLFGASAIAPVAVILPAKSHSDVIIAAIAARDLQKAKAYAKKHNIPNVHESYQDLLDDVTIDAVYIPLPNGLHYEWAIRALKAGKHVLLEKPFVSNHSEATSLYDIHLSLPNPRPVLLEAFHYRFHPAFHIFLSCLDSPNISSARANLCAPAYAFPKNDIRFDYDLSGGSVMDMGTYCISLLRGVFNNEPEECLSAVPRIMPQPYDQNCDQAMSASWRFPNGGIGSIDVDLAKTKWGIPAFDTPAVIVEHKEVPVTAPVSASASTSVPVTLAEGETHQMARKVSFWNFVGPSIWHRIDILDAHTIRSADGKLVKKWAVTESKKAYTYTADKATVASSSPSPSSTIGEPYWFTYRYQLEEFINRIKGRPGPAPAAAWISPKDSVQQMKMIDSAYVKAGLPLRPSSSMLSGS